MTFLSKKKIVAGSLAAVLLVSGSWCARGVYDKFVHRGIYSKLLGIQSVLDDAFLYDYDEEKAADYAALGLSVSLDDPYTVYYNKQQFSDYMNAGSGDFVGIGVTVMFDKENDEIKVISVMDNSPGFEAGILPGDVITAVDGEKYTGTQMNDAVSKIRGLDLEGSVEGTSVNVTVRRSGEEKELTIVRKRIHQDTVKSEMLSNNTGYIRISSFNRGDGKDELSTSDEFMNALDELTGKGMEKLIIDVRDNGGGDVDVVSKIVDRLVPEGLIMYTIDKKGRRDEIKSDSRELSMPMAILVNGNSASASELMTGALRDHKKATVIGTKTFGKGVMQRVYPFSDGSGMSVTVARYYTPNGICVQDEGITPDIISELPEDIKDTPVSSLDKNKDVQLQKAIEVLSEQ